jgi:acyl-coenzyme A synthetase/AMP-(fatty) acid ligase
VAVDPSLSLKTRLRNALADKALDDDAPRLFAAATNVGLRDAALGASVSGGADALAGRSVLIRTREPVFAALALIDLDGMAKRVVLCPPDFADEHLDGVIAAAGIDVLVTDSPGVYPQPKGLTVLTVGRPIVGQAPTPMGTTPTEWVMFTSGTTGAPKMVVHTLEGLTGAIKPAAAPEPVVWGTFYDIRRYGGLQILLRALLGGASMVLASCEEPQADLIARLAAHHVTHLSGTPSHWRRALTHPAAKALAPRYARLSGEIADQAVLDSLKAFLPGASVGHAYASTEAGVGFEVTDGREGFPAALVEALGGDVEMKVADGSLRLRSRRSASRYVGPHAPAVAEADGFVDTGDMVELRGDRYYFVGRRGGVINVGGLKVHPEEIETVINRHAAVRSSLVRGRRNPITGAVVVAEVVLNHPDEATNEATKTGILAACRESLAPFKVPAIIKVVASLDLTAGGKLARAHA